MTKVCLEHRDEIKHKPNPLFAISAKHVMSWRGAFSTCKAYMGF